VSHGGSALTACHDLGVELAGQRPSYEELAELVVLQAKAIEQLTARVTELEAEVAELRRRLGMNSTNSSCPPSSDGLAKPKRSSGRASGRGRRKQPGSPGSPGSTLALIARPDRVVEHRPDRCANAACGADLVDAMEYARQRRQVFELPQPRMTVTEHQIVAVACGCGQVTSAAAPAGVSGRVQYGPTVKRRGVRAGGAVPAVCPRGR
jgi:transposase